MLWPSSSLFLGLEEPTLRPIFDIVLVYAIAWCTNIFLRFKWRRIT